MDRSAYNKCMIPWMKGGGPDRKLRFCIGAKICSSKSKTEAEAREVCLLPKEPKPLKSFGRGIDPVKLATCITGAVSLANLTPENFKVRLEEAIAKCSSTVKGQKAAL